MTNPPRFEGLAEDKITWYSNACVGVLTMFCGLEEDKSTWYSNGEDCVISAYIGLKEDKIAG